MKIAVVCYPTYGGSGVVATELGIALANQGNQVHFISYDKPFRLAHYNPLIYFHKVYPPDYPLFRFLPYESALAGKIMQVVEDFKIDIIHAHYAIPHAISAYLAQQALKKSHIACPYVVTLHGTDITLIGKEPSLAPLIRLSLLSSQGNSVVSRYLQHTTYQNFGENIPLIHIPNFINLAAYDTLKVDMGLKELYAPPNALLIAHVSNFRRLKRVPDLVYALEYLRHKKIDVYLMLIGDGPTYSQVERIVHQKNLRPYVHMLGPQEEVYPLLAVSDVFALPSEEESFGLAALEAMASGLPVVATQTGGLPELVIQDYNGYLYPTGNIPALAEALLQAFQNKQRLRQGALATAQKYDLPHVLPMYLDFYQEAMARV
ncbi:MAG: N-acetyl-alpha-D-glucosaminyl L-malate synthase BshA [Bacteroidia bacterium]